MSPTRPSLGLELKKFFRLAPVAALSTLLLLVPTRATHGQETTAEARTGEAPTVEVPYRSGEIEVDGRVEETAWNDAPAVTLPWEVHPGENLPAPVGTRCRLLYDEEALYLGCRAEDPRPDEVRAFYTDRDATSGHDRIFLVLDPFHDARRAFQFGVSALGVQEDLARDETSDSVDPSWDAIWHSAGRVTEAGYEIEARIPFRSLRFPATAGSREWGFYLIREWPRSDLVVTRSARLDPDEGCTLCQAGTLVGIRGVSPGLNLELGPTLTTTRVDRRVATPEDGDPDGSGGGGTGLRSGDVELEPGLDVRWSPTSDVTLNATVNPDFSQVEADAPQLDANQRFALRFPEKRPFFLEGADLFGTPIEAVFTRTVADPSGGAKVTGKRGGSAFGAMVVRDEITGILLPGSQGSSSVVLERPSTVAILRYRHDVGESGTIGALYTGRAGDGYGNHVAGADLFLRPYPALSVRAQWLHSVTSDPADVDRLRDADGGDAAQLRVAWTTREWDVGTTLWAYTPDFRADAGFVPQVDFRNAGLWIGRTFWGDPGAPFTSLQLRGGGWHTGEWAGGLLNEGLWANVVYGGPWQSRAWLNPVFSRERFAGRTFELRRLWAGFSVRPLGTLRFGVSGSGGDAIDVAGVREASELRLSPSVDLRVGRHVELRGAVHWQRLRLRGERLLRELASEVRGVYSFGTRSFVRATLQLRDTDRNPDLHADPIHPSRTSLDTELLFAYKLDPVSVLFAGYGDVRSGSVGPGFEETPLRPVERSFFLKLGYGWRP